MVKAIIGIIYAMCSRRGLIIKNVPISGGSAGVVVGGTIIALVVGPWAAVLAISVALGLQALILGYGGLGTYAANCFFMAVLTLFIDIYLSPEKDATVFFDPQIGAQRE